MDAPLRLDYAPFVEISTTIYWISLPDGRYVVFGAVANHLLTSTVDLPNVSDFETNYKVSTHGVVSEDEGIARVAIDSQSFQQPSQRRYDIQAAVIYVGHARFGAATSAPVWTIKRVTLDVSGNPTAEQWTMVGLAVWDDRATESYS